MDKVEPPPTLDNPSSKVKTEEEDILTDDDDETVVISLTTGEQATDDKNDIAPLIDVRDNEPPHRSAGPSTSKVQLPRKRAKVNRRRNAAKVKAEATDTNSSKPKPDEGEEEPEEDDETLDMAETYADYVPQKWRDGKPHPDPIVETASLSGVSMPDISHTLSIPKAVINQGLLSAPQLEAIVYACQQHEFFLASGERAGYLIGDGAGVGKGRTVAGIIYENWLNGRKKSLWISVSADLKEDSTRDLKDIGAAKIEVQALSSFKYEKIRPDKFKNGVLFMTYTGLIGKTSKRGKFNTRLTQIIDWLGKEFDGVIVFDECHRAKNLCPTKTKNPTKTGIAVEALQSSLPKARIVYASATGASEPKNMAYMTRLGIWGPGTAFKAFSDFIDSIEKRGIKVMELVAMDMKLRGAYIARQLSFKGVTFKIEDVQLNLEFVDMYNQSVNLWVEAMGKFIDAIDLLELDGRTRRVIWSQFWGSHQRFFKYLCIAGKVSRAIDIAREAVIDGKCVVIGLQSTGEARTADEFETRDEEEPEDFISTAKGVFQNLVEKQFPHIKVNTTPPATRRNSRKKPVNTKYNVKRERFDDSESDSDAGSSYNAMGFFNTSAAVSGNDSDSESSANTDTGSYNVGGRKRKLGSKAPRNTGANSPLPFMPGEASLQQVARDRKELLEKIEALGNVLPKNSLDQLINELGGPSQVAELTGRKMRLVQLENGKIDYQSRIEVGVTTSQINLTEKRRFMDGEKLIAIISEAASNGISLQSDRRAKNTRPRVHITIELPWSADRAIQQFGRTHRSNQANSPEYVFLISAIAGERRFASVVAKRLESLVRILQFKYAHLDYSVFELCTGWFKCQVTMENLSMGKIRKSPLVTEILPLKFNLLRILSSVFHKS
ncbi:Protein strawberry notch 1 [Folsomia candida]|uniref:Protein strawberry notch 1 n=1 Tax=Folsomia candida TaxID=158441 RepID=A0A226E2Q8_FOLCA|nr:Protein strawberry notch 1 [Folsomia candida]